MLQLIWFGLIVVNIIIGIIGLIIVIKINFLDVPFN